MSQSYEMYVVIKDYDPARADAIQEAANREWNFEDWYPYMAPGELVDRGIEMSASGTSNLCGGEGEREFALRLRNAIWEANGQYCEVEVTTTYLENLPHEDYEFDEDDYEEWRKTQATTTQETT